MKNVVLKYIYHYILHMFTIYCNMLYFPKG
uniref:Uncharacterized protein n=1 Tax=Anguilla anguilla TaxID=7936 RepID=A0A0E9VLP5_ANGAN